MFDGFARVGPQLRVLWANLSGAQRIALFSVVLMTVGTVSLLVHFAGEPDYTTLYANLTPEDAAQIADELSAANVRYELTAAGTAIQVPVERVYELRLQMAGKGLPSSGPVGFEVFDENGLGMTPFQQKIHFQRALEGELGRTISRLGPVRWARVHISIPDKQVFRRDRKEPTAAVVVGMIPGQTLAGSELAGITQLVAGSVEGLSGSHVTIVDSKGNLLSKSGGDDEDLLAGNALEMQRSVEGQLAERAQNLLDAALGPGKSVVTVAATITRKHFSEKQARVNPDEAVVVSENRSEESRSTPSAAFGGIPGTPSNVPGGEPPTASPSENGTETVTREQNKFEVSRSESETIVPMGEVTKLSVAVLVDGTYTPAAEGGDTTEPTYAPRTAEDLQTYAQIVRSAIGFDESRGDQMQVQNLQFRSPVEGLDIEEPKIWESPELRMMLPGLVRVFALIAGLLILVLFVLRPAIQQLSRVPIKKETGELGATPAALRIPEGDAELAIPVTTDQAKQVAEAMRQWLRE